MSKTKKFTVTNIKYDTDGQSAKKLGLPKKMEIKVPADLTIYEEIEDYISDEISNRTGYCHEGFATTPEIPN